MLHYLKIPATNTFGVKLCKNKKYIMPRIVDNIFLLKHLLKPQVWERETMPCKPSHLINVRYSYNAMVILKMIFYYPGNTQNMSDLVAAAGLGRRSVTPGSVQGNDGSFASPSPGVTNTGRNSVSPHPQAVTPPPNRPPLKISIPSRGPNAGQMVSEIHLFRNAI